MKKGLIVLVLSAFISNAYAVEVGGDELYKAYYDDNAGKSITHYCYKDISTIISGNWRKFYEIVPSDGDLREFSLRDRLKEVEKFEYMKKSDALMNAMKKDFESLQQKLYTFRTKLIEDGCAIEDKCKIEGYRKAASCEIKKPLDEILDNLDKYYTDTK